MCKGAPSEGFSTMTCDQNSDCPGGGWEVESHGRSFYVTRNHHGSKVYHRSEPCNYAPRGRIVSYRTELAAQRASDELNRKPTAHTGIAAL
uniref:Uncharacterized protein n=2 Tax=Mycolicibacterium TaxID=1866885 RepID=A0A343VRK0_9MYCO|nr:hypothetical protein B5P44_p00229 [Mycolicibacterium sp. CBMA 213]